MHTESGHLPHAYYFKKSRRLESLLIILSFEENPGVWQMNIIYGTSVFSVKVQKNTVLNWSISEGCCF